MKDSTREPLNSFQHRLMDPAVTQRQEMAAGAQLNVVRPCR